MAPTTPLRPRIEALEREAIAEALAETHGDVRASARLLAIPERTLWHRLRQYRIRPDAYRPANFAQPAR